MSCAAVGAVSVAAAGTAPCARRVPPQQQGEGVEVQGVWRGGGEGAGIWWVMLPQGEAAAVWLPVFVQQCGRYVGTSWWRYMPWQLFQGLCNSSG
jgi:hypothetical protein